MKKYFKNNIESFLLYVLLALPLLVACGDSDDNGKTKIIDGTNVSQGKKLVELYLNPDSIYSFIDHYKVEYDTKGRLSKLLKENYYRKGDFFSWEYYTKGEYSVILQMDYDFRVITTNPESSYRRQYGFALNKDGYISLIGKATINYDENGYLTGIDDLKESSLYAYNDDNEFIKAAVSPISSGNMRLFFVTYGNQQNNGDIYVRVSRTYESGKSVYISDHAVMYFVAYQAGLFGKVTNTVINLKSKNEAKALFDYDNEKKKTSGKIKFVFN